MPQEEALADVARAFGAETAHELKRALKRHGSRFFELTTARVHRLGRFTWYEAAGEPFRTRRWALTGAGVFALREGPAGLSQLFALHTPLVEADPLVQCVVHFIAEEGDEWVAGQRKLTAEKVQPPLTRDGLLSFDLVHGDDQEGSKRRVIVAFASGAVSVDVPLAWHTVRRNFMPLDDDDDATEHIPTHDPDDTHDDGPMTDDEEL
jgi:hypothetical protein